MQSVDSEGPQPKVPFYRSISGKLTLLLAFMIALTAVALTATDYAYVRALVRDSVHNELVLHGEGVREVVRSYADHQHERIALVASRTRLRQLLGSFLNDEIDVLTLQAQAGRILSDAQRSSVGFERIRIADEAGLVIVSTVKTDVGSDVSAERAFLDGRSGSSLGFPVAARGSYQSVLSSPARTNAGKLLGVVLVDLDATQLMGMVEGIRSGHDSSRVRLGSRTEDGMTRYLLFARDGGAIETLGATADSPMAAALRGERGFLDDTFDYRGVEVLASYRPVGYRDWALVSQVDAAEAYAPIGQTRNVVVTFAVVFFFLAALGGWALAHTFLGPILRLSDATGRLAAGDYGSRVDIETRDEIGALGRAFNSMTRTVEQHRNHLEDIVRDRTSQLELSRDQLAELCRALEGQADLMERDLRRAEIIQRSLLPLFPPRVDGFRTHSLYIPGRNVGGDLYDVVNIDGRHVALFIADAAGHGVSAAMLAVLFKYRLEIWDDDHRPLSPSAALTHVNTALVEDVSAPGVFVTAMVCLLDTETMVLTVASAGHPPLLIVRADGGVDLVEHTGPALGLYEDAVFGERTLEVRNGDRILLYTDGLFDVCGREAVDFDAIAKILREADDESDVLQELLDQASGGLEREDRDDMTLVLFEARSGESRFQKRDGLSLDAESMDGAQAAAEQPLSFAETETRTYLFLDGRVTWIHGQSFYDAANSVIYAERSLVIDLSGCEYLDSAMLGTLHELVETADGAGVELTLQGADETLKSAFMELGMSDVIDRIAEPIEPVPDVRERVAVPATDLRSQQLRLLKAHEVLADLNEDNRREFGPVVEDLRESMGRTLE